MARIVTRCAERAELDPSSVGGHSLRAGFATTAAKQGKSLEAIMRQTLHRSEKVARGYIRHPKLLGDNAAVGLGRRDRERADDVSCSPRRRKLTLWGGDSDDFRANDSCTRGSSLRPRPHRDPREASVFSAGNALFYGDLHQWLRQRTERAKADADSISEAQLLGTPLDDIVEHFVSKYFIEPLRLDQNDIHTEHDQSVSLPRRNFGMQHQVAAHSITFSVGFTGSHELFSYRGSTWVSQTPRGTVKDQRLLITIVGDDLTETSVREKIASEIAIIQQYLGGVTPMIGEHNDRLVADLRSRLERRKNNVLERKRLVASLGFPVRRHNQPAMAVPLVRTKLAFALPSAPTENFQPEPTISDGDYESILQTMHQMALVMERSPTAFLNADENVLRTHFLVQLNGQFEGGASGETFNGHGKTDIFIQVGGKPVFIAECKFWKGAESLRGALDQLMSYLSWRDTKCAVVVLVRETHLSTVLEQVPDILAHHSLHKRSRATVEATWFRSVFRHPEDPNREALVTVMVFSVPVPAPA